MANDERRGRWARAVVLIPILAAALACSSNEPLRLVQMQLGRSLNADNTIAQPAVSFRPRDTVFLSVMTSGRGTGTVSVRWTYAGRVVDEPKKQIHYTYKDAAATDFRLESVSGFPPGDYGAEVFLDGQSVGTRKFRVE